MKNKINPSEDVLAWGGLVALSLIWGSSFILIKRGVEVYSPEVVGSLRVAIAGLALLPFVIKNLKGVSGKQWRFLLIVGLFGNLIPAYLFAKAETQLSSSVTGVLNALTPLNVMLIGVLAFGQTFVRNKVWGLLLAFGGAVALAVLADQKSEDFSANTYAIYVLLATLCYGISANVIKYRLGELRAVAVAALAFLTILPISCGYLFFSDFTEVLQTHAEGWSALGYISILAVIGTAFALVIFNTIIKIKSPVFAAVVTYLIPIVAIFWGILDGETLNLYQVIAIGVILGGVFWTNRAK
ncbi:MAG: DMT family transporter [Bacteroidota bacterium]